MRFSRRETRCRSGLVVSVSSHPETRLLSEHFTKSFRISRYAFFVCKPWWSILRGDTIWARKRPELKARHAKRVWGHDFPENSENSSIFLSLEWDHFVCHLKNFIVKVSLLWKMGCRSHKAYLVLRCWKHSALLEQDIALRNEACYLVLVWGDRDRPKEN